MNVRSLEIFVSDGGHGHRLLTGGWGSQQLSLSTLDDFQGLVVEMLQALLQLSFLAVVAVECRVQDHQSPQGYDLESIPRQKRGMVTINEWEPRERQQYKDKVRSASSRPHCYQQSRDEGTNKYDTAVPFDIPSKQKFLKFASIQYPQGIVFYNFFVFKLRW